MVLPKVAGSDGLDEDVHWHFLKGSPPLRSLFPCFRVPDIGGHDRERFSSLNEVHSGLYNERQKRAYNYIDEIGAEQGVRLPNGYLTVVK